MSGRNASREGQVSSPNQKKLKKPRQNDAHNMVLSKDGGA